MNNCIICYKDYKDKNDKVKIRCGHTFCKTCIEKWVYENNNCPVCRHKGIMYQCLHCDKIKYSKKGQNIDLCRDCEFIITDLKHKAMNKIKLLKDLKRRYKKLRWWKKIRIKIKNFSILKFIKNSIKLLRNIILFLTGIKKVSPEYKGIYHILLGVTWAIFALTPLSALVIFGAVCLAIGNTVYGLVNVCVEPDDDDLYINSLISNRPREIRPGRDLIMPIPRDDIEVLVLRLQHMNEIRRVLVDINQDD